MDDLVSIFVISVNQYQSNISKHYAEYVIECSISFFNFLICIIIF